MHFLIISRFFPPQGGPGVQRTLKFVKYLPEFSVKPIVITEYQPRASKWCPEDTSLLSEVPPTTPIIRVKWPDLSTGNRLQRWFTEVAGQVGALSVTPAALMVTMSPFEDIELAIKLSSELKIPWFADLRDPWHFDEFRPHRHLIHRLVARYSMYRRLRTASAIIFNTESAATKYINFCNTLHLKSPPVSAITNGFDPDDFEPALNSSPSGKFSITHTGFFHTTEGLRQVRRSIVYSLLGSYERGTRILPRSPYYLLHALSRIRHTHPQIYTDIQVNFAGALSQDDIRLIDQTKTNDIVRVLGYVPHHQSTALLASSSLLFFPMHAVRSGQRASIIPGKLFEYLASGRPILATVPEGDARDLLLECGNHFVTKPADLDALASSILKAFIEVSNGTHSHRTTTTTTLLKYSRLALTRRLVRLLEEHSCVQPSDHRGSR